MKKLSTISLFIFGVVVTSILTAGLVFYQDSKTNKISDAQVGIYAKTTMDKLSSSGKNIILNKEEISKHNVQSDCWLLIDGKVYDITSYFGLHPGGNSIMAPTCGKDATAAYNEQNPYATTSSGKSEHPSDADKLLSDYYLGNLDQIIVQQYISPDIYTEPVLPVINTPVLNDNIITPTTPTVVTKPTTTIKPPTPTTNSLTLNMLEISKHNKASNCWLLISGKVYDITSYFGSHPGGNSEMSPTCGTDATAAYSRQDPYATSTSVKSKHSSNAKNLLDDYYIGDFNQIVIR